MLQAFLSSIHGWLTSCNQGSAGTTEDTSAPYLEVHLWNRLLTLFTADYCVQLGPEYPPTGPYAQSRLTHVPLQFNRISCEIT